jgi:signal transduction histidine kinase
LRNRFFAITVAVILIVTLATISFHLFFLKQERLRLIDHQVRYTATALVESNLDLSLVEVRKVDFDTIDRIISEELGENRIGKFFVIRNTEGKILFESTSAKVLPLAGIPQSPQWLTIENKRQYIRVLNLQLPRIPDRTMQVGLVIDQELLSPKLFSKTNLIFLGSIITLGLVVAGFLTSTLLQPIKKLEVFVSTVAKEPSSSQLPELPENLKSFTRTIPHDEFSNLLMGLQALIERVNLGYRLSRVWTYQMAHELKTPLALLNVELERQQSDGSLEAGLAQVLSNELNGISDTVSSFLNWAELENSRQIPQPYANRVSKVLEKITRRFNAKEPGRVILNSEAEDFYILCDPNHLEQTLQNLISNALKYSPSSEPVEVELGKNSLRIKDRGPGLSLEVTERLGEPFNKGSNAIGHGLGLAWVKSVAKIYGWSIQFESEKGLSSSAPATLGTTVTLHFPTAGN